MTWQVLWQPRAKKDLSRLDPPVQERIIAAIVHLAATAQGDVVRMKRIRPPEWRLRVGSWRVRFRRDDQRRLLQVLRVLPRDKVYR